MIECDYCNEWFNTPTELKEHIESQPYMHSRFEGNSFRCSCCGCGDVFTRSASQIAPKHYCSRACKGSAKLDKPAPELYKLKALVRDDFACQECGMSGPTHIREYGELPHIHHTGDHQHIKDIDGVVTLCQDCHGTKPKVTR